ncbi:MAG: ATP-grasp domain-containing protein [Salinivirgaceae bacterium]|nr:ATP-grasp domain-containing protein [Salinivirgaceae bacterium]MDD4746772.1 ATP-grasp domain-containing protein [Salinivirgaceae bacterium]MDY0280630.1 ATP-grasp domain-containing protein [Salinivirgaceae bacterium]
MKMAILYNELSENAAADEADVLDQVNLVEKHLVSLGHSTEHIQVSLDLKTLRKTLERGQYDALFNLTESIDNFGELITFGPALLDVLKIPYTGSSYEAIFLTSNKPIAKKIMQFHDIPVPLSITLENLNQIKDTTRYIIKPIWEDGSLFLDEECVVTGARLKERIYDIDFRFFFIEQYVDGREFNISILASSNGPVVLVPAEIVFTNYDNEKPKIVGYAAKWNTESFEYQNTQRSFTKISSTLRRELNHICLQCWDSFNLKGYARVDIRLDEYEAPYVLEINANPCISPDSGFIAALNESGIQEVDAIRRIVEDLN